ncbi:hypothetical protein PWT90_07417 [Aphanocladium album]|nr:hypothetical protein PWT90_07417 [Aphanocladium album]
MNYDNRVDSGIGLDDLADEPEHTTLGSQESQISRGLGIILDYLNSGNGEHNLCELQRRAREWCQSYFHTRTFNCGVPEQVLSVHPNLFDLGKRSYERLDSSPPPLVLDDDDDDDDDELSSDSFSLPPSIDDTSSEESFAGESFPSYAEPVLLDDDTLYGIIERYDQDHQPIEERRLAQVMREIADEAAATGDDTSPHRIMPFEIRIRAVDLVESPIIFFIPEVVVHMAHLVIPKAHTYKHLIDHVRRRVAAEEAARGDVTDLPVVLSPPPGLQSPILMPRSTSIKRRRSFSTGDDSSEECRRDKKWSILTALLHR